MLTLLIVLVLRSPLGRRVEWEEDTKQICEASESSVRKMANAQYQEANTKKSWIPPINHFLSTKECRLLHTHMWGIRNICMGLL